MKQKRIRNYLRLCRKERGLTQTEVARILGLQSSSLISRWEKGFVLPEIQNALKMAAIYDTTVDFVYQDLRLDYEDELLHKVEALVQAKGGCYVEVE